MGLGGLDSNGRCPRPPGRLTVLLPRLAVRRPSLTTARFPAPLSG
jgi:hypothetical protein